MLLLQMKQNLNQTIENPGKFLVVAYMERSAMIIQEERRTHLKQRPFQIEY